MDGLSVIIPIYNVENYLNDCLVSVKNSIRDNLNIQIILVDDGSTDRSREIAKRFAIKYSNNFFYYSKKNGGLSDARNFGLQYVKYNYVSFIDSDDLIDNNYFSEIITALDNNPDMIVFDWINVIDNYELDIIKGIEFPEHLWTVQPSAWNKVYKRTLFNDINFPKGQIYEDVGTTYKLLHLVDEFMYINKPLYKYRKNRGGSILSTISPKINDIYSVLDITYNYYKSMNLLSNQNNDGLCYQYVKLLIWSNMYRQLKFYKYDLIGFYKKMKETRKDILLKFPNWKNNRYILMNRDFFTDRFGGNYISTMDRIGKSFFETVFFIIRVLLKNYKKK